MSTSTLSITFKEPCAYVPCEQEAYLTCDDCGKRVCGTHAVRLSMWCLYHKDVCEDCYHAHCQQREEGVRV